MAITVFCWLGVGVGLVHRIRCDFYELANRTIRNGVLLGQMTELVVVAVAVVVAAAAAAAAVVVVVPLLISWQWMLLLLMLLLRIPILSPSLPPFPMAEMYSTLTFWLPFLQMGYNCWASTSVEHASRWKAFPMILTYLVNSPHTRYIQHCTVQCNNCDSTDSFHVDATSVICIHNILQGVATYVVIAWLRILRKQPSMH